MKKEIKKKITIEDLAVIVNKGFSGVDEKFKEVHKKMDKGFSDVRKEIEDLAIMTGRGFEGVDKRFSELDSRMSNRVDDVERNLSYKIDGLSNRIDDLSLNRATREELKMLSIRVEKVEKKILK